MKTKQLTLFLLFTICLTLIPCDVNAQTKEKSQFVIMIDPGHGGKDSGTPGSRRYKVYEKHIALDVSLGLGKLIKERMPYVKVLYTRINDVFPKLEDRSNLANEKDADLFISIHCNAQGGGKRSAYGSETFVLGLHKNATNLEVAKRENSVIFLEEDYEESYQGFDPSSPESMIGMILSQEEYLEQSIELANYIETEFKVTGKRKSRGVSQAGFWVLAHTYMPSVLVELGFLTNHKEEDFLNSSQGKKIMTKSLFNAVKKYVDARVASNDVRAVVETPQIDTPKVTKVDPTAPRIIDGVTFKVQIAAGSKKLNPKPYNFKGLTDVSREKDGRIYKYFYGATSDFTAIKLKRKEAKEKGFESCFLVAYKDGKKVSVADVLK